MKSNPGVVIITGGGRGIGLAICQKLASEGYTVAVTDIDPEAACACAVAITAEGGRAAGYGLDVSSGAQVDAVLTAVERDLGPPGALVNNAGIWSDQPFLDLPESDWKRTLDVNLTGAFLCTQRFARRRVAAKAAGAVVNIASVSAFSVRPGASHYAASKAALVMLTKSAAWELGPHAIRVNAVAPGLIAIHEGHGSPEFNAAMMKMIPRGKSGKPQEIASIVSFLLSPAAEIISGDCIVADGGFLTGRSLPLFQSS